MTKQIRWSKPFNPEKKLFDYFDENIKYKSIIDQIYIHPLHQGSDEHKNRYKFLTTNDIYNKIKFVILAYTDQRIINQYDFDELDIDLGELTQTRGWAANFYYESNYEPYYQLLILLTEEGYDVRPQWRQFRDDMKTVWPLIPDFHRRIGKDSMYYVDPPADYDKDKPFPQYPLPEDINYDNIKIKKI